MSNIKLKDRKLLYIMSKEPEGRK